MKVLKNKRLSLGSALLAGAMMLGGGSTAAWAGGDTSGQLIADTSFDAQNSTITLPLRKGKLKSGETVWFVLLEASTDYYSGRVGLSYVPRMAKMNGTSVVREARFDRDGTLVFDKGGVDFTPERSLDPGAAPDFFPPRGFNIGALGDGDYTPFARIRNARNVIVNAPTLAFDVDESKLNAMCEGAVDHSVVHDRVVRICPRDGTVTLKTNLGLADGKKYQFISTESNADLVSVLEAATYAPRLKGLEHGDFGQPDSYITPNYVTVNGQTGKDNPERQGINSAISDGLSVIDVFQAAPGVRTQDYSPAWDIYPVVWNDKARADGAVKRLTSAAEVKAMVAKGYIDGLGGAFGAAGFSVVCPVVFKGG